MLWVPKLLFGLTQTQLPSLLKKKKLISNFHCENELNIIKLQFFFSLIRQRHLNKIIFTLYHHTFYLLKQL